MGLEAECEARFKGESSLGKAHLDNQALQFRGGFRLKIPLSEVSSVESRRGVLLVRSAQGEAAFELGKAAEKWVLKVRYPRSLIDKLGVKPDFRVSVLGVQDDDFWEHLTKRTSDISRDSAADESDVVFLAAEEVADLGKLAHLQKRIKRNGAIWVVWRKNRKDFNGNHVRTGAIESGLVDIKIVSFSDSLSALKLVIPKDRR